MALATALLSCCSTARNPFAEEIARSQASPTLEELAFKYGTDKSKDDHKYVDAYMMLFDPIRWKVRNVSEIGVATGQSLQVWLDYFSEAHLWGFDKTMHNTVKHTFEKNPRATLVLTNAYSASMDDDWFRAKLGWEKESMDIIIDDAVHHVQYCSTLLVKFWPYVRPGGYYVVEDVGPPSGDAQTKGARDEPTAWNEEHMSPAAAQIVKENAAFVVDSSFGHRNFSHYSNTTLWGGTRIHARDRYYHTSHLIVLRKRAAEHPQLPWRQFTGLGANGEGGGAMRRDWIYETRAAGAAAKAGAAHTGGS